MYVDAVWTLSPVFPSVFSLFHFHCYYSNLWRTFIEIIINRAGAERLLHLKTRYSSATNTTETSGHLFLYRTFHRTFVSNIYSETSIPALDFKRCLLKDSRGYPVNSICLICVDIDFVMQHRKSDVVRKILILMLRYN